MQSDGEVVYPGVHQWHGRRDNHNVWLKAASRTRYVTFCENVLYVSKGEVALADMEGDNLGRFSEVFMWSLKSRANRSDAYFFNVGAFAQGVSLRPV